MIYSQDGRQMAIETPLGKDVLLLRGFSGEEGVSRLFRFELDLLATRSSIAFQDIVGKRATVRTSLADGQRYFNGIISSFSQGGTDATFTRYRVVLVPWLWLLTRTTNCRVFQNLSVPDILKAVFDEHGFRDVRNQLTRSYPTREYCVQYRETDFNFVCRLMEESGISYFFEHDRDRHTLVMADDRSAYQPCPGQARIRYQRTMGALVTEEQVISAWSATQEVRSTAVALSDFNFETPRTQLAVRVDGQHPSPTGARHEIYDYPGNYANRTDGEALARLRLEQQEVQQLVFTGTSHCRSLAAGCRFELTQHDRASFNQGYVLTVVSHEASETAYEAGGEGTFGYSNCFTCLPLTTPYRPPQLARRPTVHGAQTAVVVGKTGEEIWTDRYGRVKVQFHWDREGRRDENSSCWVRISQNWAGKRWGSFFLPRVGQEVLVEFLEGDPDRPVVIGCLYNGDQVPPYDLPAAQTRGTIKSNSSRGGGGFNELRFEDKKGQEQILLHACKDLDVAVGLAHREAVGGSHHRSIARDEVVSVGGEMHLVVGGDRNVQIGGDASAAVGGSLVSSIGRGHAETAGQEIVLNAGTKIVLVAGAEITLQAPGGFVKVDPTGVTLQGTLVNINSGGAPGVGTSETPKSPRRPDAVQE